MGAMAQVPLGQLTVVWLVSAEEGCTAHHLLLSNQSFSVKNQEVARNALAQCKT